VRVSEGEKKGGLGHRQLTWEKKKGVRGGDFRSGLSCVEGVRKKVAASLGKWGIQTEFASGGGRFVAAGLSLVGSKATKGTPWGERTGGRGLLTHKRRPNRGERLQQGEGGGEGEQFLNLNNNGVYQGEIKKNRGKKALPEKNRNKERTIPIPASCSQKKKLVPLGARGVGGGGSGRLKWWVSS